MTSHGAPRLSLSSEEKLSLLENKSPSSPASDSSSVFDLPSRRSSASRLDALAPTLLSGIPKRIPSPLTLLHNISWRPLVVRSLIFLLPSFVQHRVTGHRDGPKPTRLHPTAYLDGMRGLAALFVYFCHYFYQSYVIADGYGADGSNYYLLKLPFLRLWYQGPPMVCLFFVISGYALSCKPLKLARSRSWDELMGNLSSLVFRRGIRLYLPTAISTLLVIVLLRVGAYEWNRDFARDRTYMRNVVETHPERMKSGAAQFWDWAWHMYNFVHVFGWDKYGGSTSYDVHLWTIPVEFRCSMYLFLVLIGTARLRTRLRMLVVAGVALFTYRNSRWEMVLFYCGMLLAELDLIRSASAAATAPAPLPTDEKAPAGAAAAQKSWLPSLFWNLVSVVALYLMCQPDTKADVTPGWVWLTSMIPTWWAEEKYRYYQSIGAVIFVLCVAHSAAWQRFFNTSVVQYFGKISYAIYLMHGPVMHTVGYAIERTAYSITGVEGHWYDVGFALGACGAIPSVIWGADVFWRAVDMPTVKFAKWVESKWTVRT